MLVPSVFTSSVSGSPPQGHLICLSSPALVLWDPPCATCSWDPGSEINEQIETDSNMRRCDLYKHVCLCLAAPPYFSPLSSVTHTTVLFWCLIGRKSSTSGMSNNMAKIADARKTVEQLKLEVNIERMMVSEERSLWGLWHHLAFSNFLHVLSITQISIMKEQKLFHLFRFIWLISYHVKCLETLQIRAGQKVPSTHIDTYIHIINNTEHNNYLKIERSRL